jgi:polyribonucleotide nucleotidyltransferase
MAKLERQFAGRPLIIETGRMARQADGSCTLQFGETMVLCAATAQDNPTHLPFFPLTVEYRERTYAAGKFPGGFIKREGRPSDKEILAARLTDRPLRPLFPEGFANEVQIFVTVVSADQQNDADVLAVTGASMALALSRIPFAEPVAAVRIGRIQGHWVLNPTFAQLEYSDLDIIVAGSADAITMVEGGALEVSEDEIADGLVVAHAGIRELIALQQELLDMVEVPATMQWTPKEVAPELRARVEEMAGGRVLDALRVAGKHERADALAAVKGEINTGLAGEFEGAEKEIGSVFKELEKRAMREMILAEGVRSDGRGTDEVRAITVEVGVLPRAHGSALFTRGQTQSLGTATLGTQDDEQAYDTIDFPTQQKKSFMLHYNFPPYSTGEVRPVRGTSRREIGHGHLAERALEPLLPAYEEFPYTIRVVSDILESNGSSSMASVCSGSLALMDAGVPMRAAVAGVAMGLIKEGDRVAILTDILGSEDALGDMDFKVAGHARGRDLHPDGHQARGRALHRPDARRAAQGDTRRGCTSSARWRRRSPSRPGDVEVRSADHHHQGPRGQDRRDHRAQGEDDPRDPGVHRRQHQHRRRRHRDDRGRRERSRRDGAPDDRGDDRGGRGRPDLRRRGEEHHRVRRLRGDPSGDGGAPPHLGDPGRAGSTRPRTRSRRRRRAGEAPLDRREGPPAAVAEGRTGRAGAEGRVAGLSRAVRRGAPGYRSRCPGAFVHPAS